MKVGNSMKFDWDFCGQEKIADFLQSAIISERIAHTYLFVGLSNLGKYTLAREFVASIFCRCQGEIIPCGQCPDCEQFKNNIHPDVYLVKRMTDEKSGKLKKDISVEQIRDLKNRLQQATFLSAYKAAIIPEAQYLNLNAANALLKILEEPTARTVIILITNNIRRLPATIVSRSQVFKFLPVSNSKIESYLKEQEIGESKKISRLSHGRPGLALALAYNNEALSVYQKYTVGFFSLLEADINKRFDLISDLIVWHSDEALNWEQISSLFVNWEALIRDFLLAKSGAEPLIANIDYSEIIKKQSQIFSTARFLNILKNISQAREYFGQNVNTKIILENLIINL